MYGNNPFYWYQYRLKFINLSKNMFGMEEDGRRDEESKVYNCLKKFNTFQSPPFLFPHLPPSIHKERLKNISVYHFPMLVGIVGAQRRTSSMCILNYNINFNVTIHAKNILFQWYCLVSFIRTRVQIPPYPFVNSPPPPTGK